MELPPPPRDYLVKLVDNLYQYNDEYNRKNHKECEEIKVSHISEELQKVVNIIDLVTKQCKNEEEEGELIVLRAKALHVLPEFSPENLEALNRYVKRNPHCTEAWNLLGETFWKNKDLNSAKICFQTSLKTKKNIVALRNLSLLLRTFTGAQDVTFNNHKASLEYARQAVTMDSDNGTSWYFLGNVYTALYFKFDQNPEFLKELLHSYEQAGKCSDTEFIAELHYNRAVAFSYIEEYSNALIYLDKAKAADPWWEEPYKYFANLELFLSEVDEQIKKKGNMKKARLKKLLGTLTPKNEEQSVHLLNQTQEAAKKKFVAAKLSELKIGKNCGKLVIGKVLSSTFSDETATLCCCLIDTEHTCVAIHIYNLAKGKGVKIGDTVCIPEPFLKEIKVKFDKKELEINWIKVENPLVMLVNCKPLHFDCRASAQCGNVVSYR